MTKIILGVLFAVFISAHIPAKTGSSHDTGTLNIHQLAKNGDNEKLKELLDQYPLIVNKKDAYGWTALQIATVMGKYKTVKLLLKKGASVNETDRFGFTALHLATIKKDNKLFELLVSHGAVIKNESSASDSKSLPEVRKELAQLLKGGKSGAKGGGGKNPAVNTVMTLKKEWIDVELTREAIRRVKQQAEVMMNRRFNRFGTGTDAATGNNGLHIAAQFGTSGDVSQIIKLHPDWVRKGNRFGITPLHYAAARGDRAVAAIIIDAGALLEARTNTGITPLYGAVSAGQYDTVELLVSRGAKVNAATNDGAVPLHSVTRKDVAELLINAGANVKAKNNQGFTPLHLVAQHGKIEVAAYLLSRGARMEGRTNAGWTPLCEAIFGKKPEMVQFLVKKGANLNPKTISGSTPRQIAKSLKFTAILKFLEKQGAH